MSVNRLSKAEIMELIHGLPTEEQEQLLEEMSEQWLKRELNRGIEQADKGDTVDSERVFADLEQRYLKMIDGSTLQLPPQLRKAFAGSPPFTANQRFFLLEALDANQTASVLSADCISIMQGHHWVDSVEAVVRL